MKSFSTQLILVTQFENKSLNNYLTFIENIAQSGITAVQLRHKFASDKAQEQLAFTLKEILAPYQIPLFINDNVLLTKKVDAFGVHLGQTDGSIIKAREYLGKNKCIGLSIETLAELQMANQLPIDYVAASAIFATDNKKNIKTFWGLSGLTHFVTKTHHPVVAIGGINHNNLNQVLETKVHGIAVIGAIHQAKNPIETTKQLSVIIQEYHEKSH